MKMNIANVKSSRKFLAALFVAMLALVCVAGAATMYENTEVSAATTDIQHVSGTLSADAVYAGNVQIDAGKTLTVPAEITITIGATGTNCTFTVYGTLILKEGAGLEIASGGTNKLQLAENGKIEITAGGSKTTVTVADLKNKEFVGIAAKVVADVTEGTTFGCLEGNKVTVTASTLSQGTVTLDAPSPVVFVADEMTDLGAATEIIVKGGATLSTQEDDVLTTAGKITVTKGTLAGVIESSGEVYIGSTSVFLAVLTLDGYTGVFNAASLATLGEDGVAGESAPGTVQIADGPDTSYVAFDNAKAASAVTISSVESDDGDYLLVAGSVKNYNSSADSVDALVELGGNVSIAETLSIQKFVKIEIAGTLTVMADAYLNIADSAILKVSSDDTLIVEGTVNIAEDAEHCGAGVEVKGDGVIISVSNVLNFTNFKAVEYAIQTGTATETVLTYYYVTFANAVGMIPEAVDNTITLKGNVELSEDVDCIIPAEATVEFGAFDLTVKDDASLIVEEGAAVALENILRETEYVIDEITVYAGIYKALDDAPEGSIIELKMDVTVVRDIVLADGQTLKIATTDKELTIGGDEDVIGGDEDVTFTVYGDIEVTFANGLVISAGSGLIMDGGAIVAISIDNDGTIDVISGSIETAEAIAYNGDSVINSALYYKGDGEQPEAYVYTDIVSALAAEDMFSGIVSGYSYNFQFVVSVLGEVETASVTVPADIGLFVGGYYDGANQQTKPSVLLSDVTLLSDSENKKVSALIVVSGLSGSEFAGAVQIDLYSALATYGGGFANIDAVVTFGDSVVVLDGSFNGVIAAVDEKAPNNGSGVSYDFGKYGAATATVFKDMPAALLIDGRLESGTVSADGSIWSYLKMSGDSGFTMESGVLYIEKIYVWGTSVVYFGTPATAIASPGLEIHGYGDATIYLDTGTGIVVVYSDVVIDGGVSWSPSLTSLKSMEFSIEGMLYATQYANVPSSDSKVKAILLVPEIDGYSFVGWYDAPVGGSIFSANNPAYFGVIFESYGLIEVATFQVTFQYAE
ncbi:MAG: hypothetical protein RBR71_13980, partial [Gudongella sp.]|nr:hypothetical protein [Gudongella sp.]